jgi:protoheme IX farnesyltransferase
VVLLLLLTALVAMVLAGQGTVSLRRLGWTMLGGYLCAGGAGAINCFLDRDLDARMARTGRRAIPSGRIAPIRALAFGLLLCLVSVPILWFGVNPAAAVLALLGLGVYVGIYTWWLKRRSPWNVVVGGLAGAAPPLVGWVAAAGTLSAMAFLLAAIVFFWTPAHFWGLALMRREEYAKAGVPMLPVVRGEGATRRQILIYAALTVLLTAIPVVRGTMGALYGVAAGILGTLFLALAARMLHKAGAATDRRFYLFSLAYLALVFLAMLTEQVIR